MRKTVIKGIFGGKLLLMLSSQWKLVIYIFILIFLYITMHYDVSDSALAVLDNDQILKELKTDYTTRVAELQKFSTEQYTEKILRINHSDLHAPVTPPISVSR